MKKRSVWLVVAAAVLPLFLLLAFQIAYSAREQARRVEADALAQAKVISAGSDAVVARTLGALDVLATDTALRQGDLRGAYARAREIAALEPDWAGVIVTRQGTRAPLFDTRVQFGAPSSFAVPADGGAASVVRGGAGCPCVALGKAAAGARGDIVTVLLSTRPLLQLLPAAHGRYEVSAIATRDGRFVARSINDADRAGRPGSKYLRAAAAGGTQSGTYRGFTLEGFKNYTAFARSATTGWTAHVAMASHMVDTPGRRAFGSLAMAGLLSLAFAALMIAFVLRQLTENRRISEGMQHNQKLEALGQLTGGIAHDFNNLLTPIVGALDFLSKREGLDPRAQRMAASGLSSANRATKLTRQLLAFSRQQKLSMQPVEMCGLLDDIRTLLAQSAGSDMRVELNLAPRPCWVETDPLQLELALINLVINARDASPPGAAIEITVEPVTHRGQSAWQVAVADRGVGMSAEVQSRAFEPFFTTKQQGRGTGLGLAQVFALARQSLGEVRIDSAPGEGTRVTLILPACAAPEEIAPGPLADARPGRATLRILVVDDEPEVRDAIAMLLQDDGHDVDAAAGGDEALTMLAERAYQLALVDFAMPGMNGAELIARAREIHPQMQFLIVTGYVNSEAVELAAPGTPMLLKPFDPDILCATVRQIVAA